MRISDWSSDVCSSDLRQCAGRGEEDERESCGSCHDPWCHEFLPWLMEQDRSYGKALAANCRTVGIFRTPRFFPGRCWPQPLAACPSISCVNSSAVLGSAMPHPWPTSPPASARQRGVASSL